METAHRQGLIGFWCAAVLLLAACAGPVEQPAAETPAAPLPPVVVADIPAPAEVLDDDPPSAKPLVDELAAARPTMICPPTATQGGAIICTTTANTTILLDGKPVAVSDDEGVAVVGLSRTQASPVQVMARMAEGLPAPFASVEILARHDTVSKFEMECGKIAPQSEKDKRHAEVSWVKKDNALKSFNPPLAPFALIKPADGAYSSPFGATRTYVPKTNDCEGSTSVHNGQDIAVGTGTEIRAPMAGTIILADPDLFYEGGCVFLDLGRGVVSVTMHMSRIDVKPGDRVEQGQLLGLSGSTGRVTGPHLHWALKYRNVTSPDRGTDIWLDPAILLAINSPPN